MFIRSHNRLLFTKLRLLKNLKKKTLHAQYTCVIHLWLKSLSTWRNEWFRVMRPLGAFVLVLLEAQIKSSTLISHDSFCMFSIK